MKSLKWLVPVSLMVCFLVLRPPLAAQTPEAEHLQQEVDELEELIDRAADAGNEEEARELRHRRDILLDELREHQDHDEAGEREHHEDEIEMHARELDVRRHAIEVEMAEMELKRQRLELLSNPLATSLDAIEMAGHHLEHEEAVEFFSELLEESTDFPVKQALRQRLVELNLELDRRDDAFKQLRRLIVPSDD